VSTKPPQGTSAGRNGSSGVLTTSLSAIVPEKSRGNKKCDGEEEEEEEEEKRHTCPRSFPPAPDNLPPRATIRCLKRLKEETSVGGIKKVKVAHTDPSSWQSACR